MTSPVGSSVPGDTEKGGSKLWTGDDAITEVEVRMCDRCHNLGDQDWEHKRVVHALLHDRAQALAAKDRLLQRVQSTQMRKVGSPGLIVNDCGDDNHRWDGSDPDQFCLVCYATGATA